MAAGMEVSARRGTEGLLLAPPFLAAPHPIPAAGCLHEGIEQIDTVISACPAAAESRVVVIREEPNTTAMAGGIRGDRDGS